MIVQEPSTLIDPVVEPASSVRVIEVNSIDQLDHYRMVWQSLLARTPDATFFHTHDWLEVYWRHFGAEQRLRVLIVLSHDKPIGIVPLTVIRERTRLGRLRVLTYPLHDWANFYGPIGPDRAATLLAAARHLRKAPRDWDLLDLRWTDRDVIDRSRTPAALRAAGFQGHEAPWKDTFLVETTGSWDDYWKARKSKFRNNVRRHERRVNELGDVQFERYRPGGAARGDGDPLWDRYNECVEIARQSWQGSSTDGTTLSHPSVAAYFREAHRAAARLGMVDFTLLRVDEQPIAFGYNYHHQGCVLGMRIGFVPQYAKCGVGNFLYLRTFQGCFERGDRAFDMGVGSAEIKQPWLTRVATSYRYLHYPRFAPRVQMLRLKHWLRDRRAKYKPQPA